MVQFNTARDNINGVLQCLNSLPFNNDANDVSKHLIKTSTFATNKMNEWYIENEKYFTHELGKKDSNMRYIFLPRPNGSEFRFESLGKKKIVANQLDINDINIITIDKSGMFSSTRSYETFSTFIRDNNDNLIAGINVNNVTMKRLMQKDIHGIAIKSLYGNIDYNDSGWTYNDGFIEFDSSLSQKYRIEVLGISRTGSNNQSVVDWIFMGENPDVSTN